MTTAAQIARARAGARWDGLSAKEKQQLLDESDPAGGAAMRSGDDYERVRGPNPASPGDALTAGEVAQHVELVAEFGYTVVEGAFEPALVERLRVDIERIKEVAAAGGDGVIDGIGKTQATFGETANFQSNLLSKSRASWEIAVHPNLLRIIEGVLGHHCLASSFGFRHIGPGEKAQGLHTDDGLYDFSVFQRPFAKQLVCNSMVALQDFTLENGATRIVPTSHRWAEYPPGSEAFVDDPELEVHDMVMPAGSVAIWAGGVWHGSGANSSESWRDAVNMNYLPRRRPAAGERHADHAARAGAGDAAAAAGAGRVHTRRRPRAQQRRASGQAARQGKRDGAAKVLARAREAARGGCARERNRGVPGAQGARPALNESKLRK